MIRIMRIREVIEVTGLSRTTIWRRVRDHEFPVPLKLGSLKTRSVGWREEDIERWLNGLEEIDN
ncbi:MAG: AlpA family phage regulatory protein [Acidobacteriia bacterium]|nr:AlpA family phage regulatory protein [Terriglobia bacterium]